MPLFRAAKPKHAKPSRLGPVFAAGSLATAFVVADGAALSSAAHAASGGDFARLRACESGGDYSINTGNGFYGAYQFDRATWRSLGYSGVASSASPATQDEAARRLQAQRGWSPWPACSRGLGSGRPAPDRASRSAARVVLADLRSDDAPAFAGHVLSTADAGSYRGDVEQWQRRMAARGWPLAVDGYFGGQSAGVAARFAAEKALSARPGTVNAVVWAAAWNLPVS